MGKKKVAKQTQEDVLKEQEKLSTTQNKVQAQKSIPRVTTRGRAYIQSTYNNTIITLTDMMGRVITWASAGSVGFKGPKKATPYAASRVVEILTERVKKSGMQEIEIFVKGIGSGRESAIRALAAAGFEVKLIKDVTPLPHNGPRPRKARRV
ncbi:MAG: 30S ribosomal protein S11 [Candidatus Paceibacterota bacterium]|jgi:small subunit ribosomal protein S11